MILGPTIIRECSVCGKHISQSSMVSGNTFGARFWTDGSIDAPMLLDNSWLIKCQHCASLVWIDEQKQVGQIEHKGPFAPVDERFSNARPGFTPTLQDYADFLETCKNNQDKERYVRVRAWWAGNDSSRNTDKIPPLDAFEAQNLRALLNLLDEDNDSDRIMKAEAFRELGQFADAEKLLEYKFEKKLLKTASFIRELNRKQITTVAEMKFE